MDELPTVVLLQVLQFLDHSALHVAEQTSHTFLELTRKHELWKDLAVAQVTFSNTLKCVDLWKKMACLAQCTAADDKQLLGNVEAFSSADRPNESPMNTLMPSRCWMELQKLPIMETEEVELTTMGERMQHRCGCSSGRSCYWSSSASTDQNATEFIDYTLNGSCMVNAVQIVPYRVFWHPDSPTYAPQKVRFEFFDVDDVTTLQKEGPTGMQNQFLGTRAAAMKPFYISHDYDVKNDMTLQEFVLSRKVAASKKTVLRITLIGRHQAQTFELPQALLDEDEDRPKYYCCLSHVNICGVPWKSVQSESDSTVAATPSYKLSSNLRMAALTGLAVYMTACYKGIIGRTRRWD